MLIFQGIVTVIFLIIGIKSRAFFLMALGQIFIELFMFMGIMGKVLKSIYFMLAHKEH